MKANVTAMALIWPTSEREVLALRERVGAASAVRGVVSGVFAVAPQTKLKNRNASVFIVVGFAIVDELSFMAFRYIR